MNFSNYFFVTKTYFFLAFFLTIHSISSSGILNFRLADLAKDQRILQTAREIAARILDQDPQLTKPIHARLKQYMDTHGKRMKAWSRIS